MPTRQQHIWVFEFFQLLELHFLKIPRPKIHSMVVSVEISVQLSSATVKPVHCSSVGCTSCTQILRAAHTVPTYCPPFHRVQPCTVIGLVVCETIEFFFFGVNMNAVLLILSQVRDHTTGV